MSENLYARIESLNNELVNSSDVTTRLSVRLGDNAMRDAELNTRLQIARAQGQNLHPIYLQSSALLHERSKLFTDLSAKLKHSSDLCNETVKAIDELLSLGGES